MTDNNYDNNGNKLVHVKAYNRSDGTRADENKAATSQTTE